MKGFVGLPGSGRGLRGSGRGWERAGASPGPAGFEGVLRRGTGRAEGFVRSLGLGEGERAPGKGAWGFPGLRRALGGSEGGL